MSDDNNNGNMKTTVQHMLSKINTPVGFALRNNNSNNDDRFTMDMLRIKFGARLINQDKAFQGSFGIVSIFSSVSITGQCRIKTESMTMFQMVH